MKPPPFESMIPSELCLKCDVCCRFPEADSSLVPFFTEEEVKRAFNGGLPPDSFGGAKSGRIRLVPFPIEVESPGHQEGCICPAFNPRNQECSIYEVRPFDCQLYPFALMKNKTKEGIVLGIDNKCPFIRDPLNRAIIESFGKKWVKLLKSPSYQEMFQKYPGLIGPFQDEVTILYSL